jgi:sugar O-acyltransferase (sialic acid O-acetyltransferase NeuD family)
MLRDLAIYGAGGFGREIALMVHQINGNSPSWNFIGFFDDHKKKGDFVDDSRILGNYDDINKSSDALSLVLAVSDPVIRQQMRKTILNPDIQYPTLIHPSANIGSQRNIVGLGCLVTAGCIFTTGINLSDFVIVNLATTIGHDVYIGEFSSVMPGVNISGNVTIGKNVLIGTGAKILQNIAIGDSCKIGAGAVVTKSFENGQTIIGIPGRPLRR